jgi:hypothetical protein
VISTPRAFVMETRLSTLVSRLLGPLDPNETHWGGGAEVQLGGRATRVWYFIHGADSQAALDDAERMLNRLDALDTAARQGMHAQLAEGGSIIAMFKAHHVEDIDSDVARELFKTNRLDELTDAAFIASLVLAAVRVTPGIAARMISLDYAVGAGKPVGDVLMVSVSSDAEVTDITHES